jgi:aryl-alcohol dehydrogenase-like predicted oxidoreductase
MQHRMIGQLSVSVIGLGTNNFGMAIEEPQAKRVVDAAIDAGINYFDTADIYGGTKSEEFLGRALGSRRGDVIVATKFGHAGAEPPDGRGGAPDWVRSSLESSLTRLGTDYIDHYQIHVADEQTPLDETLGVLTELVQAGLVREIGCSNFSRDLLDDATAVSKHRDLAQFVSVQNHYSLLHIDPERDVLPACARNDIAFVPYFPLESGLLTGKYDDGVPPGSRMAKWSGGMADVFLNEENLERVRRLTEFASAEGHTILELAFAWLLGHPLVSSVIAGATTPEQVAANAAAADWRIQPAQRAEATLLTTL